MQRLPETSSPPRRPASFLTAVILFAAVSCGTPGADPDATPASPPGLGPADIDAGADPRADFYVFANGGWLARTAIPPDESSWATWNEMAMRTEAQLREILEEAASDTLAAEGSRRRKLGDFFASGMDEARIESEGTRPLATILARIDALADVDGLRAEIARLHAAGIFALFRFSSEQDSGDSTRVIAVLSQGGLGLPDPDHYKRDDARSGELRTSYRVHVAKMLSLLGPEAKAAEQDANLVMTIENALAQASMTREERRDPKAVYHLMSLDGLQSLAPRWDWRDYTREIGLPGIAELNVAQPQFVRKLGELLGSVPMEAWKAYLRWHVVRALAAALPSFFEAEAFAFYGTMLQGAAKQRPRWNRVLRVLERPLGEALGEAYVARFFSPEAKRRANEMVSNLKAAFRERLQTRAWMSEETRRLATAKLDAMARKIGYPDRWRDDSALRVRREAPFVDNVLAGNAFLFRRAMEKIGKPVDREEWPVPAYTVDAYYNTSKNEILFPAGVLQPPFFDERQDDALNYGGMGAIIGHEITHGFDDGGSQFDAQGNLANWWGPEDRREFEARGERMERQFSSFVAIDDQKVNGRLTLGENIADLGGLTIAYHAFQRAMGKKRAPALDGFTPEQRFFLAWARCWREKRRPEALRLQLQVDPHAPARFRCLGPLQNLPEFHAAFGCRPGDPMVRPEDERVEIW